MAIIRSGNGYNRAHASGNVRTTGLTMDDIGNAITNDLVNNVYLSKIPTAPFSNVQDSRDISMLIQGDIPIVAHCS